MLPAIIALCNFYSKMLRRLRSMASRYASIYPDSYEVIAMRFVVAEMDADIDTISSLPLADAEIGLQNLRAAAIQLLENVQAQASGLGDVPSDIMKDPAVHLSLAHRVTLREIMQQPMLIGGI